MLHPITGEKLVPTTLVEFPEQARLQSVWDNWQEEIRQGFDTPNMQEDEQ